MKTGLFLFTVFFFTSFIQLNLPQNLNNQSPYLEIKKAILGDDWKPIRGPWDPRPPIPRGPIK